MIMLNELVPRYEYKPIYPTRRRLYSVARRRTRRFPGEFHRLKASSEAIWRTPLIEHARITTDNEPESVMAQVV